MNKIKIGFLPLYLKLYDECCPELRPKLEAFAATIRSEYEKRNVEVIAVAPCCLKPEFAEAVKNFENAQVDAIVTLHLAYSPSLESSDILAETKLPIVILDTTPDFEFGFKQKAEAISCNHGIHGVQDMCNLLIRNGKQFMIEAGHWRESDVIDRTLPHLKACKIAGTMRKARVGIIGEPFAGMGDFAIDFGVLRKTIGMDVVSLDCGKLRQLLNDIPEEMIDAEIRDNLKNFTAGEYSDKAMRNTAAVSLAVRKWLDDEKLDAFTVNFLNVTKASGIPVVPFLEASKAMSRGKGYAGEGDVLTAALTGALMAVFPETTFTEMFCPDWKDNRIFLSHMGEINPDLCSDKAVLQEKPFPFTDAENPVVATGCLKPGNACLINLAPGQDETYTLIVVPVKVCAAECQKTMDKVIRGWLEPSIPLSDLLSAYSKLGGTHHSVLAYGCEPEIITETAGIMGWKSAILD